MDARQEFDEPDEPALAVAMGFIFPRELVRAV